MTAADILYHITVAAKPTDLVETAHGQMPYSQWLAEVEIPRIRRKCDWPIAIYTNPKTGEISLAHLRVRPASFEPAAPATSTVATGAAVPPSRTIGLAPADDAPPPADATSVTSRLVVDPASAAASAGSAALSVTAAPASISLTVADDLAPATSTAALRA